MTFQGTIDWQSAYGTSWQGVDKWEYTMVFDDAFTCIKQGGCMATASGAEPHEQSRFGVSLIYVNAATEACFVSLLERDPATLPPAPEITDQDAAADLADLTEIPAADIVEQVRVLQQGLSGAVVPRLVSALLTYQAPACFTDLLTILAASRV